MTKNQIHEWHERTDDGKRRYLRGYWNSRDWAFSVLEPGAEDWFRIAEPGVELYLALRDVLWRKYQRRRVPFKFIEGLDALLAKMGADVPKAYESES